MKYVWGMPNTKSTMLVLKQVMCSFGIALCIGMDSLGSRINAIADSFVSKKPKKKKTNHEVAVCFKNIVFIISYHTIYKQIN